MLFNSYKSDLFRSEFRQKLQSKIINRSFKKINFNCPFNYKNLSLKLQSIKLFILLFLIKNISNQFENQIFLKLINAIFKKEEEVMPQLKSCL